MDTEYWMVRVDLSVKTGAPPVGAGAFVEGNVLIVGESPSSPDPDPLVPESPFCSSRGCSGWFNSLIEEAGVDERKLFWVNAVLKDGRCTDLVRLTAALKPSAVVALGSVAKRACSAAGVDCIGGYHPQYWKRFRSRDEYPVVGLLSFLTRSVPDRSWL